MSQVRQYLNQNRERECSHSVWFGFTVITCKNMGKSLWNTFIEMKNVTKSELCFTKKCWLNGITNSLWAKC